MWQNVQAAPADAILGLADAFRGDTDPRKVNLGVGVYKDESGVTPILRAVKEAEQLLVEREVSKDYLPIPGDMSFAGPVKELLFGAGHAAVVENRVVTAHTPGGTGALRVGAELLHRFLPKATVWVSTPTWVNHRGIFAAAGFPLREYPYYDAMRMGIDFSALLETLQNVPAGDIVVLHACCHNPCGFDLSRAEWDAIIEVAKKKEWLPFLDFAYQGFAESPEADRYAVAGFAATGQDMLVAGSFSKNFGLYDERCGALSLIAPTAAQAEVAMSHMKTVIRVLYSNPPAHGGLIVATILADRRLRAAWREELAAMRQRIVDMRRLLVDGLKARGVNRDFSFINRQRGMFSYTGLDNRVVERLRGEKHIYMVAGGRINLAGLTRKNIDYVCDSICKALADE
ncbi:MAG: aspartate/tyrosine/aromatic aminotransferase [Desulfobulbaceae bacterium]|jgi:aspartate aminotransferase/aromatic-amino-acid transaminase|nr:aspartate/tyrosine/aromatic aminotransferase [Desulfobulbaceae bacterium]